MRMAMQINNSLLLLLHLRPFRLLLLIFLDGLLVLLVLLVLLLLNFLLLVLVVEFQRFCPVFLGVLVLVVDLHGLDGGLHGEALHALDVDVLLALLGSDALGLPALAAPAPSRPHLRRVDLALDLLGRVLRWLGFTTHSAYIITTQRNAFKSRQTYKWTPTKKKACFVEPFRLLSLLMDAFRMSFCGRICVFAFKNAAEQQSHIWRSEYFAR